MAALGQARTARSDPGQAERAVLEALALAPDVFEVRLGAYRFYFYNHRYDEALPHAEAILAQAARRLNVAGDWRAVGGQDAPFGEMETAPGLYLQALLAWGYCQVRLGHTAPGRAAVAKVAELDPRDRFGARAFLDLIDRRERGADDAD
ncbi:MAG: hypothetical protein KDE22_05340 [Rhodobacterales bacterium]|nr:hypothetical protein [Rhodobacterales bacterium]